jgi:hypothetical protein
VLEVDLDAARHQPERIVEARAVAHHRAEHHLVVAALRAAEPAAHPGLEEHGAALEVPARRGEARHGQVAVEERLGARRRRLHLAHERGAPEPVLRVREVALRDVHELVVHQRVHALARRVGLERVRDRRDVEREQVARRRVDAGAAVVGEVLEQERRRLRRLPAEARALPLERVAERPRGVRAEEAERLEPDEPKLRGLDVRHPERVVVLCRRHRCGDRRREQQHSSQQTPHPLALPSREPEG